MSLYLFHEEVNAMRRIVLLHLFILVSRGDEYNERDRSVISLYLFHDETQVKNGTMVMREGGVLFHLFLLVS